MQASDIRTYKPTYIGAVVWVRDFLRPLVQSYSYVKSYDLLLLEWVELLAFRNLMGITHCDVTERFDEKPIVKTYYEHALLREIRRRTFNHLYYRYLRGKTIDKGHLSIMVELLNKVEWVYPYFDSSSEERADVENAVSMYMQGECYAAIDSYSPLFRRTRRGYMEKGKLRENNGLANWDSSIPEIKQRFSPAELLLSITRKEFKEAHGKMYNLFKEERQEYPLKDGYMDQYHINLAVEEAVEVAYFRLRVLSGMHVTRKEVTSVCRLERREFIKTLHSNDEKKIQSELDWIREVQEGRMVRYKNRVSRLNVPNFKQPQHDYGWGVADLDSRRRPPRNVANWSRTKRSQRQKKPSSSESTEQSVCNSPNPQIILTPINQHEKRPEPYSVPLSTSQLLDVLAETS